MFEITTDIGKKVKYTEEQLRKEVRQAVDFAVNDKEYKLKDLTPDFIAEDITGKIEVPHGVGEDALAVIKDELEVLSK